MKELFIEWMYRTVKIPYQWIFKKKEAWPVTLQDYLRMPEESLGFHLGCFLCQHNFDIQATLEEHDVFHVLTHTGITVLDEINMQFYLLGNGKRSPFLFLVIGTGLVFYPFKIKNFYQSYCQGKRAHRFYDLDFLQLLPQPIAHLQQTLNIKP